MSKFIRDAALDALLNDALAGSTELYLCSGDPADRTQARANSLSGVTGSAGTTETPPTATGPEDHTPNGRRVSWGAKTGVSIVVAGTAATVCLCSGTDLLLKTDLAATVVVAINDTVDLGAFIHSVADAA